jgi:branched-chain amino acid transport system ATP-binding protein
MSLLKIEHLNKAFGSLVVTRDLTLEVAEGERHVIIGPNGAGKTSLINQIGGQLIPDSGRILIRGVDVTGLPPEALVEHGLARTFQKNTLFPRLSVFENVRLGVQARYGSAFDLIVRALHLIDINKRAFTTLDRMKLDHLAGHVVSSLSYGDQRQLEVAVALAGDPSLLLLDEPTSGLSPTETRQMIETIKFFPSPTGSPFSTTAKCWRAGHPIRSPATSGFAKSIWARAFDADSRKPSRLLRPEPRAAGRFARRKGG